MTFYQNLTGSFSAVSTNFWIFSSTWLRIWSYLTISYRETLKFAKRRETIFDENHDFFGFSDFETHSLGKFSSKFWFLSLISSRSRRNLASREERIQKSIHTAFFLAGRSWQNFNAFSYCKYEQTWPDSISAKDQEKNFLSIFPVRCGRIESDVIDSFFLKCVKTRRCANQFAYTLLFYSLKREGF